MLENKNVLSQFKTEVANELGITNYDQIDKGQLTSRQNGYVGGNMTKKMVLQHQLKFDVIDRHYLNHTHSRYIDISMVIP